MPVDGPAARHSALVESGELTFDPAQQALAAELEACFRGLRREHRRWLRKPRRVPGLYIHGGVGRGKTLLMDLFADALSRAGIAVLRIHFHRFMDRVHRELKRRGGGRDPLTDVAADLAAETRVLCFDEFHVADIADAMILGELLEGLFARRLTLVATSNTAPDELYAGGLQRERFLPAIDRLKHHCRVIGMSDGEDFRLRELTRHPVYYTPLDEDADKALEREFTALSPGEAVSTAALRVRGRTLEPVRRAGSVAWFTFAELCDGPRASGDYIDLARRFSTLVVSGVPVMGDDHDNAARRFIHLVDECYDRCVKLVVSAAAEPEALYTGKRLAGPFARTSSRLVEMQTREFLGRAHRP